MPWQTSTPMSQRMSFVSAVLHRAPGETIKSVAAQFRISERVGHKWLKRFADGGPAALADRSRAPLVAPHQVPREQQQRICALREAHPTWGARKLRAVLSAEAPTTHWPAPSTMTAVLKRHGLIPPRPRRHRDRATWATTHLTTADAPNAVWAADFKGQFRVGSGAYCYPLTVTDLFSRFILGLEVCPTVAGATAEVVFRTLFQRFGLPAVIRTDNGVPFGSPCALGGLSALAIWWIRLGIRPERIRKGQPQENGAHERMHRTLKAETTRPAAATLEAQQRRFRGWQTTFNTQRPHESLGQTPPACHYAGSPRPFPSRLPPLEYPAQCELRQVASSGVISWHGTRVFLSEALAGEFISLQEETEDVWTIRFGPLTLGHYHQSLLQFLSNVSWTGVVD